MSNDSTSETGCVIGLYNTGVNTTLSTDGHGTTCEHDEAWGAFVVEMANWLPNGEASRWIGLECLHYDDPSTEDPFGYGAPPGEYQFETQFTLVEGVDPSKIVISGSYAADNEVTRLELNGVGQDYEPCEKTAFSSWHSFTLKGNFSLGTNTVRFTVRNLPYDYDATGKVANPMGFRCEFGGVSIVQPTPDPTIPSPPCPNQCQCPGFGGPGSGPSNSSGKGPSAGPPNRPFEYSGHPVRYFNGEISLVVNDVASGGFGQSWGHRRIYSNRLSDDVDYGNGYNWTVPSWPSLFEQPDGTIVVVFSPRETFWFDQVGETYVGRYGAEHILVHDSQNAVFRLTYPDGRVWAIHDLESGTTHPGRFKRVTAPGGQVTEAVSYNSDHRITEIRRSATVEGGTTTESYLYAYLTSGENAGRLESVTLRRGDEGAWGNVARALYTYYMANDTNGSQGDLKTATHQLPNGSNWVDGDVHYYRYWKAGESEGFAHGLKYVLEPQPYANLAADSEVADPLTASDAKVAAYATHYYEYNSDRRVTRERILGGSQEITFSYTEGTHSDGYNYWKRRTTETQADGSVVIVHSNYLGQVLLREEKDSLTATESSIDYFQYDGDGRLVLHATPTALASYVDDAGSDANELVVTYRSEGGIYDIGLVYLYTYYTETDPVQGKAIGRNEYDQIQQGRDGVPIKLRKYEYGQHTAGGATIHPLTKEIVYRNEDGSGAMATTYSYTWHPGSLQAEAIITTLPAVPAEQNGSGVAATRVERYDQRGNLVWSKDERGTITYRQYDLVTGAMVQTIQDVDDVLLTLPSGWITPADGGRHLVTEYECDVYGRALQVLGPEHEAVIEDEARNVRTVTWSVYKDAEREVWTAQGYVTEGAFNSSSSESSYDCWLVNPVSITKRNASGHTLESIQAVRSSSAGRLSASDSFPQSSYVRWTSHQYDDLGRLLSTRVYHTIPETGDGQRGTCYDQTEFGYDAMGRQNRQVSLGGTITRTVHNSQGHAVAVYVGADDTGATDADPAGGATDSNNMVLVTEYEYNPASGCASCEGGGLDPARRRPNLPRDQLSLRLAQPARIRRRR